MVRWTRDDRIHLFYELMHPYIDGDFQEWLTRRGFFDAPASTRYHGAYEGGLFDHSYQVTRNLFNLWTNCNLKWQRPKSPFLIGMFHDLCKIDCYAHPLIGATEDGDPIFDQNAWEYRADTGLKGHGEKSIMLLSMHMTLTEEEIMCIRYHMGAFVKESEWNDYTRAITRFPNVLWTHHADMLATHVDGC